MREHWRRSHRRCARRWRRTIAFELVANGDAGLDAIPGRLRPYRYLLSPTLDTQRFDADYLRDALEQRVQDLGSPAAALIEPLVG